MFCIGKYLRLEPYEKPWQGYRYIHIHGEYIHSDMENRLLLWDRVEIHFYPGFINWMK